ncbi:MAG: hypothetical protein ABIN67_07810 [Ferruginibacter sp.]
MNLIPAKCVELNEKRKIYSVSENNKKYTLHNKSGVVIRQVKIDRCLAQRENEKRCDFLMDSSDLRIAIFIELKGGDLNSAVKQIYSTIIYLKTEFKGYRIDARIIGSKDVPGFISTPDYRRLAKEILPTKGTIERRTNKVFVEDV